MRVITIAIITLTLLGCESRVSPRDDHASVEASEAVAAANSASDKSPAPDSESPTIAAATPSNSATPTVDSIIEAILEPHSYAKHPTFTPGKMDREKRAAIEHLPNPQALHERLVERFLVAAGFGYSRMPYVDIDPAATVVIEDAQYAVESVQLVGLMKSEKPRVYLRSNPLIGNKTQESEFRALDDFEEGALERIRRGETLIADGTRMMGALCALDDCLDCHRVHVGDLLGAFSYKLKACEFDPD